ncbi:cyclophilin-like fold protein [Microlunatus antarcticus]|uniref:Cyclophilin-like domain-containing protein n=1 Tax=Microlunatus antarcticus TaxID=53388 RepID=A0A7W5JUX9_9ACTN|nr:hypothetical protein [Microlunatus antarcticus]
MRPTLRLLLAALVLGSACSVGPGDSPAASEPTPARTPTGPGTSSPRAPSPTRSTSPGVTPVRVVVGGRTFAAELFDNPTARDLADRLPLTVAMDDLHGTEKTGGLPQALTTDGAPRGSDPDVGEIGYYAPGRDLVFYYGDMGYYPGIVRIGRFDESIARLVDEGDGVSVRVEVQTP